MTSSPALAQVNEFLENTTISSTARSVRSGNPLIPVSEKPPVMWSVDSVWIPFTGNDTTTTANRERVSDKCTSNADKQHQVHKALSSLLVLIAATYPDHATGVPISAKDTAQWCTFICTWARLIFTQPLEHPGKGAIDTPITATYAQGLVDWYDEVVEITSGITGTLTMEKIRDKGRELCKTFTLPTLHNLTVDMLKLVVKRDYPKEEPAYYALVVYMAGRALTERTSGAVHGKRPVNLQKKFNEGEVWASIGGELKMSKGSYSNIAKAWQMNTTMRIGLLTPLIQLDAGEAYMTGNIVYTTFKLLRGAGMAHVGLIMAFLRQYPYACKLPEIRSEISYLALHSRALKASPLHIQPYYKLLYADAAGLFDSKTLTRLTALACAILAEKSDTVKDYNYVKDDMLISAFHDLRDLEEVLSD